ncbi:hypothetical protein OE88DRAFT_1658445 [Heliocybe sulcata]|uniref:Uncharacterized protein n=1 Tax=Heliocybe sulcata TaxID=5364 RepID=A0A5C3N380_9AGAM|nr:hypothetical protein OE88DRAFT_1658445 [Heliocybe sulcata]
MESSQTAQNQQASSTEEIEWRRAVEDLDAQLKRYEATERTMDQQAKQEEAQKLVNAMNRIADNHPDPKVQEEWRQKALTFESGSEAERRGLLGDIGKGVGVLLSVPFALVGAAVFATGAAIYGAGNLVKGVGNIMTGGALERKRSRKLSSAGEKVQ